MSIAVSGDPEGIRTPSTLQLGLSGLVRYLPYLASWGAYGVPQIGPRGAASQDGAPEGSYGISANCKDEGDSQGVLAQGLPCLLGPGLRQAPFCEVSTASALPPVGFLVCWDARRRSFTCRIGVNCRSPGRERRRW